jgi:hypothetical protein
VGLEDPFLPTRILSSTQVEGRFNVEGRTVVAGALVLCAAVLALSGILAVREVGKQTCIEKAEARFPAVEDC